MNTLLHRMIGAARFDVQTYESVEADRSSQSAAIFIVIAASVAAAVGSGLRSWSDVAGATFVAVVSWLVWVGLTYLIGTRLLPGKATQSSLGEVLRTTGFSASPGILRFLGLIPGVGVPIFFAITIWMLFTFVVAVRQALDYASSRRALAVCFLGWLIHGLVFFAFVMSAI